LLEIVRLVLVIKIQEVVWVQPILLGLMRELVFTRVAAQMVLVITQVSLKIKQVALVFLIEKLLLDWIPSIVILAPEVLALLLGLALDSLALGLKGHLGHLEVDRWELACAL